MQHGSTRTADAGAGTGGDVSAAFVLEAIRREIVAGRYQPGDELPTRRALTQTLGASIVTVQRAFDRLQHEGFVRAAGRRGTFVADKPPHRTHFGLVFPNRADAWGNWSRFWLAIQQAASGCCREQACEMSAYFYGSHAAELDSQRLVREVREQKLAGLIFTSPPDPAMLALLREAGIPAVAIACQVLPDIPVVIPDARRLTVMAGEYLRQQGCRRVAVLCMLHGPEGMPVLQSELASAGVTVPPQWMLSLPMDGLWAARQVTHLLMSGDAATRPDGLLVADDNLLHPVTAGLLDAGVEPGRNLQVVTHFNFPEMVAATLPMMRLGFDCRQLVARCLEILETVRRGETPPPASQIPPVFEHQLQTAPVVVLPH